MRRRFRMRSRRARSHRRHSRRRSFRKAGGSLWGLAGRVIPTVAFVEQITGKGRASGKYAGLSMVQKAQTLANNLTGNMFGFNIFGGVPTFTQQINPSGIANKYTGIGVASIVGSLVMRKAGINVPYMSRIFAIGRKMLPAGIVGGLFDDSLGNASQNFPAGSLPSATGVFGYASARPMNQ